MTGRKKDETSSGAKPAVGPDDPRYLDLSYFPLQEPGELWSAARMKQVAAVEAHHKRMTQSHIKDSSSTAGESGGKGRSGQKGKARRRESTERAIALAAVIDGSRSAQTAFPQLIPARPYCADDYTQGIVIRNRARALHYRHIQYNRANSVDWLLFDVDRAEACSAHEDANLPGPTFIAVNPANGHAHLAYLLAQPVLRFEASSGKPLIWFTDVKRGYTKRLGADPSFHGLLAKNPLHPDWRTLWLAPKPFTFETLDAALDQNDKRRVAQAAESFAAGESNWLFDKLRTTLYGEAARWLGHPDAFRSRAKDLANRLNESSDKPRSTKEVDATVRSVTRWIEACFSKERFSAIQSHRAKRRWADHESAEATKPWEKQNISRRTYYRRKKSKPGEPT